LIAFATYGLWPRAKPAEHAAYEPLAPSPAPAPAPEPASAVAAPGPLASPAEAPLPSVPPPSAEPRASADEEDVELTGAARAEREEREREGREEGQPSAAPSAPRAAEEPASVASQRPSIATMPAPTPAAPAVRGVLRVTPAPTTVPAEPLVRAQGASPAPVEAVVPPPTAPPAPAAPARVVPRGPTRDAVAIEQVVPKFPARARRLEVTEGTVALEYTVDRTGAVKNAVVISADPPGVFDDAALAAIQRWRYQPKLQDGTPVETRKRFKFTFR
jgi:TonB family protein